jgi:hypothetical protein
MNCNKMHQKFTLLHFDKICDEIYDEIYDKIYDEICDEIHVYSSPPSLPSL